MQETQSPASFSAETAPAAAASQPLSRTSSSSSANSSSSSFRSRKSSKLSLDLSSLPPLQPPAVPTNTLLFTNLNHADVFRPDNLETIRDLVSQSAALHSWAPLKSFRRIVASFYSAEDAARVRDVWDGEPVLGEACHVYFGRATPLDAGKGQQVQHLALPDAGKLFFISPPPSPPHDWEMRLEGAPNKQVHAEDLAEALAKLHHQAGSVDEDNTPMRSPVTPSDGGKPAARRSRSSTLVIYQPADHGSHPDLPAIAVEDLTIANAADEDEGVADDYSAGLAASFAAEKPIMAHTARPPVELMHEA